MNTLKQLKDASDYPLYCPACGQHRQLQRNKAKAEQQAEQRTTPGGKAIPVDDKSIKVLFIDSSFVDNTMTRALTEKNRVATTIAGGSVTEQPKAVDYISSLNAQAYQDSRATALITDIQGNNRKITSVNEAAGWETIPNCTRCGLSWSAVPNPGAALIRKLETVVDAELGRIITLFYPNFNKLVSAVATKTEFSIGYVQRVLEGERKNSEIMQALITEFRDRLNKSNTGTLL